MEEKFRLTNSYLVILNAVSLLREEGYETSAKGLGDILSGTHRDPLAQRFDCFGHYAKLGRRSFLSRIRLLERYGYLRYRYEPEIDDYILLLTELGQSKVKPIRWHKHRQNSTNIIKIKEK